MREICSILEDLLDVSLDLEGVARDRVTYSESIRRIQVMLCRLQLLQARSPGDSTSAVGYRQLERLTMQKPQIGLSWLDADDVCNRL